MRTFLFTLVVALAMVFVVTPSMRPSAVASARANADTLRQLEAEFMKAASEHGSAGYMSYYADDAVEVPNGAPLI
ncbi:MAG: hypothetical protein WB919_09585, partial [Candidatus Sulfotelmatobacter sp.]